ncbi:LexA/Signal peptidase, partial [Dothidotthia symphoricarpi CBS 119687]
RRLAYTVNGLSGLCLLLWIRDHHIRLDHVRGSSMAPTLSPDANETGDEDWVFVRPYSEAWSSKRGLERGDVVTFWKPHNPEQVGIKRVVALQGDTVYPKRGYALEEQGKRLQGGMDGLPDEDRDSVAWGREQGKIVVPYGHVWVEGDNWRRSFDSRDFGPVSRGVVEGRAVAVWRGWFDVRVMGDERGRNGKGASRVVERKGEAVVPDVFLE